MCPKSCVLCSWGLPATHRFLDQAAGPWMPAGLRGLRQQLTRPASRLLPPPQTRKWTAEEKEALEQYVEQVGKPGWTVHDRGFMLTGGSFMAHPPR